MPASSCLAMAGGRSIFHWGLRRGILAPLALGVEMTASMECLDLVNQGHVNPLWPEVQRESGGFAPCNVYPVKWELYFTGAYPACPVGRNYRTGVESLTIPLGQNLFHWGLQFQNKAFSKSSTNAVFVELFYVYLMCRKEHSAERYNLNLNSVEGINCGTHRIQ